MKRSEMVELIASVHADWHLLTAGETRSFPDVEFAEFLLLSIEKSGMLPPNRQALSWSEIGIPDEGESEKPRFTVYKWEPEE
jgi:hypothetical protein